MVPYLEAIAALPWVQAVYDENKNPRGARRNGNVIVTLKAGFVFADTWRAVGRFSHIRTASRQSARKYIKGDDAAWLNLIAERPGVSYAREANDTECLTGSAQARYTVGLLRGFGWDGPDYSPRSGPQWFATVEDALQATREGRIVQYSRTPEEKPRKADAVPAWEPLAEESIEMCLTHSLNRAIEQLYNTSHQGDQIDAARLRWLRDRLDLLTPQPRKTSTSTRDAHREGKALAQLQEHPAVETAYFDPETDNSDIVVHLCHDYLFANGGQIQTFERPSVALEAVQEQTRKRPRITSEEQENAARYLYIRDTPWPAALHPVITMQKNAIWDREIDKARGVKDSMLNVNVRPAYLPRIPSFNEWWLSLEDGQRRAYIDDKWRLADLSYREGFMIACHAAMRLIIKHTEIPADAQHPTRDHKVILGEELAGVIMGLRSSAFR